MKRNKSMKRSVILLLAGLVTGAIAFADEVSPSRAALIADTFFDNHTPSVKLSSNTTLSQEEAPLYYIFNNPDGGWVIVSGEDSTYPVLAYSRESSLVESEMHESIRYWLDGLAQDIRNVREAGPYYDEKIKAAWKSVGSVRNASSKCLETAAWGQNSPFNDLCPKISGEGGRSVTGCVATAMAIVLRYHGYPEKGNGTIGDYTTASKKYHVESYSIDSHEYHISEIPLYTNFGSWTTEQKGYVAQLMYDCGVMVEMDYSYNGSGAFSVDILPALKDHMGYSGRGSYLERSLFKTYDWIALLKNEIDQNRPVLYGGSDSEEGGGHQFVVDGYDSNGNMRINWGWNGSCNGFFSLDYLGNRTDVGYVFDAGQDAVVGVEPDPDGTSGEIEKTLYLGSSSSGNGISLVSGTIAKGSTFKLRFATIWNALSPGTYNGYIRAGVLDYKGNLKEYIGEPYSLSINYWSGKTITSYSATLTKDIAPGDRIALFYTNSAGGWVPMPAERDGNFVAEYPLVDACFIRCEDSYHSGDIYVFDLITGLEAVSGVSWYYDGLPTSANLVVLTSGEHCLEARINYDGGGSETIVQNITVE